MLCEFKLVERKAQKEAKVLGGDT